MLSAPEPIAIVGMGCRFPRTIDSPENLWQLLLDGADVISDVPQERFDSTLFFDADESRAGKTYVRRGGFRDGLAEYDAEYFGISPKEAGSVDPQQRLLLECAAEAFDDAQIAPAGLEGSDTAVLMGISTRNYDNLQRRRLRTWTAYNMTGSAPCNTANRISYVYDLRGPSSAVDTACSSALTAVHHACQAIRSGRSSLALAGGVNVLLDPADFVGFSKASMLSPTGLCHPFSADADGFVHAEGAAVVLLKPLSRARADGDRIHAVIAASDTNNDGRTPGLPVPSPQAQSELLERVYREAGLDAERLVYVEAHGTGTRAGDPVECTALGQVLGRRRRAELPIGSVKANLGHLEAGAGMAGLVKAVLVLRHGIAPATPHALPLNPAIDFAGLGLAPVTSARPLEVTTEALVGVNAFGFGGANAHVVLGPPPAEVPTNDPTTARTVPVMASGRTPQAAQEAALRLADHLDSGTDGLYDTAYTSVCRRGRHQHRIVVMATGAEQAAAGLRQIAGERALPGGAAGQAVERGRVAFVFNGNGSAWAGMARDLLGGDSEFTAQVEAVDAVMTEELGHSVLARLRHAVSADLRRAEIAQPLLFTVQAGLVASLAARGITPAAVCGHSAGEIAAAYCAGLLDLPTACRVIAVRSRAQGLTAGLGTMAAVGMSARDIQPVLETYGGALSLAGVNSGQDVTVSGDTEAIEALGEELGARSVFFRRLDLDYPYHSAHMEQAREPLFTGLARAGAGAGRIPMVSTVTGTSLAHQEVDSGYWWRNMRDPVLFADAVRGLIRAHGCDVLIEVGPHPVLGAYLRRLATTGESVAVLGTLRREEPGPELLDETAAAALARGADATVAALFPERGRTVALPSYPWQRERHWIGEPHWWPEASDDTAAPVQAPELLGNRMPTADPTWHQHFEPSRVGWLSDHQVGRATVVPAAAYLDMLLAAGREMFDGPVEVTSVRVDRALTLPFADPDAELRVQTSVGGGGRAAISSRRSANDLWQEHVSGRVRRLTADEPAPLDQAAVRSRVTKTGSPQRHYELCARLGLDLGPAFRTLTELACNDHEVLARYSITVPVTTPHPAHPTALDGALQTWLCLTGSEAPLLYLPARFERVRAWHSLPATGVVHLCARPGQHPGSRELVCDLRIADPDGRVALELTGFTGRRFDATGNKPVLLTEVLRAAPHPDGVRTSPWPLPADAMAATPELGELATSRDTDEHTRFVRRFLDMAAHFTVAALTELLPGRTEITGTDLADAGVRHERMRWLHALLRVAVERDLLTSNGERRWTIRSKPAPEQSLREALTACPGDASVLYAGAVCGRHYPQLLRGELDPLDFLFSEGDSLAAKFYDHEPFLTCQYQTARALLRSMLRDWPEGRPMRVIEVGAGTGGLASWLLPEFDPATTAYAYSDISSAFFPGAARRFAEFDFVDYRTYDMTADPVGQGLPLAGYDLVLASNALHTVPDLPAALGRISALLADGGQALILESHREALLTPIFGMLDSYWEFEDDRTEGPLATWERWPRLLARADLTDAVQIGDPADESVHDFSVLLARRAPRPATTPRPSPQVQAQGGGDVPERWIIARSGGPVPSGGPVLEEALAGALRERTGNDVQTSTGVPHSSDLWQDLLGSRPGSVGVVLLTDPGERDTAPNSQVEQAVAQLGAVRALASACDERPHQSEPRVWLVCHSREAALPPTESLPAALWGAVRSLGNELPSIPIKRVCLHAALDDPAAALVEELVTATDEDEVLLTTAGRQVPRVRPLAPARRAPQGSYAATVTEFGPRFRTAWVPIEMPLPGPGEVIVNVAATALNYRDVLVAGAVIPPTYDLGLDCAGTVLAAGPDTPFTPGDRVAAVGHGLFASQVRVPADRVWRIPDGMTFAEASTMPLVFLTVQHGLGHLAHLRAGEKVLIHSGAGGIGLAALQYARMVGAQVIATAGTPCKRDLLRMLGVEHVLDSRSLRFADDVRRITGGDGVEVVLNSLAGEAQARSLELLAPHGRFLELGKRDFLADNGLPQGSFNHNLAFFGIDVGILLDSDAPLAAQHVANIGRAVADGTFRPLPYQTYPASRLQEAFTYVQQAKHIGKVVIDMTDPVQVEPAAAPYAPDPDACYLITGGLGGFGAATARHLAAKGARHLALVSRRGGNSPEAPELLADLTRQGVTATAWSADAADRDAMGEVIAQIRANGRRIGGYVHGAVIVDDDPMSELDDERVRTVLAAKMGGALVLDRLLPEVDLAVFHSSVSGLIGQLNQSSYAAANLVLDGLAHRIRARGNLGLAVRWGAIADTGWVRRHDDASRLLTEAGINATGSEQLLSVLDDLLGLAAQGAVPATVAAGDIEWAAAADFLHTLNAPRTAGLVPARAESAGPPLRVRLTHGTPAEALTMIQDTLCDLIAKILATTPGRIDRTRRLDHLGFDSLMAAELAAKLRNTFGCELPTVEIATATGIASLAQAVLTRTR